MKEEYKGYTIRHKEATQRDAAEFEASIGDSEYSNQSLAKVRKYIDNLEKKDFERTDVFVDGWRSDYNEAVVTSEVHSYYDLEVWVTYKEDKQRRKFDSRHVFLDNEENRKLIDSIKECDKEIVAFEERKNSLREQLEKYVATTERKRNA